MRETRNVEDWNPAGEYVYAKACRLGPPEAPWTKVGERVDLEVLRTANGLDNRRIRALFMQGKIEPAPKTRVKRKKRVGREKSRYAQVSQAPVAPTNAEE